jgi:putative membrane protein
LAPGMWRRISWLCAGLALLPAASAANPGVANSGLTVAQRIAPAPVATSTQPAAVSTDAFLRQAIAVAKFQSDTSKLALRKTKNDSVVGFAHQINLDYAAAGMKFRQAVAESKLPMPKDALDAGRKTLFDELSKTLPGKPFAKAYVDMVGPVLRDDLALFEAYAKAGDNARLQHFAGEMVPLIRGHLAQWDKLKK